MGSVTGNVTGRVTGNGSELPVTPRPVTGKAPPLLAMLLAALLAMLLAMLLAGCSGAGLPWDVTGNGLGSVTGNGSGLPVTPRPVTGNGSGITGSVTGNGFEAVVVVHGLRVRACPELDCAVMGFLQEGDALHVVEVVREGGAVWGRHAAGWSALCWQGAPRVSGGCER